MLYFSSKYSPTSSLREMESETGTQTSSPSVSPTPPELTSALNQASRFGTVIPNRIFVGGIDIKTNENDLGRFFSQYGTVKEVRIVNDRAGVSKGYGFVTFETPEVAQKILHDASADRLCFRDKKLNIGQAIRKQHMAMHLGGYTMASPSPPLALPASFGTMYLTTPTGYPYTYHNGVAYFHSPEPNTHPSHWPASHTVPGSPPMLSHSAPPFCAPQACYQHQGPSQCMNGHMPWAFPQSSVPSNPSPLLYVQPAELTYHPVEPFENGCVQSAVPLMEAGVPEAYMDHMMQPYAYQICLQSPLILPQGDGVKEQKFQPMRRGFTHSAVHLRPRYGRGPHYTYLRKDYPPDLHTSPPPASSPAQDALK